MSPTEFHSIRQELGLSIVRTASWLHVDRKTIQRWERGAISIPQPAAIVMLLCSRSAEVKTLVESMAVECAAPWRTASHKKAKAANKKERAKWLREGDVTHDQLVDIYTKASGLCRYCGTKVRPVFHPKSPIGFDHVVPLSRGGRHTASNIVVCCKQCNEGKGY